MSRLRIALVALMSATVAALSAVALTPGTSAQSDEPPPPLGARTSAEVERMLGEMKTSNVEGYDRKLASFGTRHTLSSQTDPKRGIGAARDWICSEFKKSAAKLGAGAWPSRNRASSRRPAPARPGADDGHQRRRHTPRHPRTPIACTSSAGTTTRAQRRHGPDGTPGADDDASGGGGARDGAGDVPQKFDATLVFMAGGRRGAKPPRRHPLRQQEKQPAARSTGCSPTTSSATRGGRTAWDRGRVRLFAEGISDKTPQELLTASRPAARTTRRPDSWRATSRRSGTDADRHVGDHDLQARPLPARRRPHPFLDHGYPAVRFTEQRGLPPPAPERARPGRHPVRRPPESSTSPTWPRWPG